MSDDSLLRPAQDLAEIRRLAGELEDQAVDRADDTDWPGGEAVAYLAPVASSEAVWNRVDGAERWNNDHDPEQQRDLSHVPDLDIEWEPPLQTLAFWSEQLRFAHDAILDARPTIESEAKWLTNSLQWIHDHEPHWDDFTRDIHAARRRLEALLLEGERQTLGIPCPKCREAGRRTRDGQVVPLVRTEHDRSRPRGCNGHGALGMCPVHRCDCGDRGGLIEEWRCGECDETYDLPHYQDEVMRDYIANAPYLEMRHMERRGVDVRPGTIRVWASRGQVRTRHNAHDETTYSVEDIETRRHAGEEEVAS